MRKLFTSESVTEGHPDKICDQISDAILDAILEKDPNGRVAAETTVTTGMALVIGEITTNCYVDIPKTVRNVINDIGYTKGEYGFDGNTCNVLTAIDEQSSDMRKDGTLPYLRPDGKTQVTVEYDEEGRIIRIDTVLISTQHDPAATLEQIRADLLKHVITPVLPADLLDDKTKYFVNPTGRFVIGGPHGDAGLTGRKIIVDTYGGYARHGGGAFSGKDPTKVDRSAAYAARYVAKNIVAAGLADKCEIQIAYAIGVAKPVSVLVDTFGTAKIPEAEIEERVSNNFDLRPAAIIRDLDLRRPIYRQVAAYGHFGRTDIDVPWERTDKAELLK